MKAYDLRGLRIEAGIRRQNDLARMIGINTETLGDIEAGKCGIDQEMYDKICAAINSKRRLVRKEVAA